MKHPRVQRINKQKMLYSLLEESRVLYAFDDDGEMIPEYTDEDGNVYYREDGTLENVYSTPIEIHASLNSSLREADFKEWGIEQSSIYSTLKIEKGILPNNFSYGTKIWYDSEVKWVDIDNNIVDDSSADFIVKGVMRERLNFDYYLLQRNNNGQSS